MVGYDAKNKNQINPVNYCGLCSLILREPAQLCCGHRLCKSCVELLAGQTISCPTCYEVSPKAEVVSDKGFKNDMQKLPILCALCPWDGVLRNYEAHLIEEHSNPPCEHCGQKFDSASSLDFHKLNECSQITVACALADYGCSSAVLRVQMAEHFKTSAHQSALLTFLHRLVFPVSMNTREKESGMDVDTLPQITTVKSRSLSETPVAHLQEVSETVDVLAFALATLHGDAERLSQQSSELTNGIKNLEGGLANLKLGVEEQNASVNGLQPTQEILSQEIVSLQQKMEDMRQVSYDGTLIWKISRFKEHLGNAKSERQTSIYSPPFYSSPTGYKMRARLYLHGDGNARRTHVSLFFVLMRSHYDSILTFPFQYKVTFCLYDQTPNQRHIIDSFRPDVRSNSFQRPRSEMNIASGIPKFAPLSLIEEATTPYVRDDTMFIKVMVDFGEVPKPLLSYLLNLNPGLPTSIQQIMLKQEADRRTQQTSPTPTPITLQGKST